jgi:tetratricopeptide (TPR) repeat protein
MTPGFDKLFDAARADRRAGRLEQAEHGYAVAADQARSKHDPLALAHALRHMSDLARERGSIAEALSSAAEAVAIYRARSDSSPLDLANALRLNALALSDSGRPEDSKPLWKEARDLYASVGVPAGVEEAEMRLATA